MPLFSVSVEFEIVVNAKTKWEADRMAEGVIRDDDDSNPSTIITKEIKDLDDLPTPWDGDCRPWGDRDPMDRTIRQIIDQTKE